MLYFNTNKQELDSEIYHELEQTWLVYLKSTLLRLGKVTWSELMQYARTLLTRFLDFMEGAEVLIPWAGDLVYDVSIPPKHFQFYV